jgi:hypothetical protein
MLVRKNPVFSAVFIVIGSLLKPLVYPFVPIIALGIFKHYRYKGLLLSAIAGAAAALAIYTPFMAIHRFSQSLNDLFFQIYNMPFISVNSHNLWFLVGGGGPWIPANTEVLGPISYKHIGIMLFLGFFLIAAYKYWKSTSEGAIYFFSASVALGFFALSTHMHENHLFHFLPLCAIFAGAIRRIRWIYFLATVTVLTNMALNDPFLMHSLKDYRIGPQITIPWIDPAPESPAIDYYTLHGQPWIAEQVKGETSFPWLAAATVNSQINVLIFAFWLFAFFTSGNFDLDSDASIRKLPPWPKLLPLVFVFMFATGIPVILRAVRIDRSHRALMDARMASRSLRAMISWPAESGCISSK